AAVALRAPGVELCHAAEPVWLPEKTAARYQYQESRHLSAGAWRACAGTGAAYPGNLDACAPAGAGGARADGSQCGRGPGRGAGAVQRTAPAATVASPAG